ncbi:MAG: response regulator [Planctomycetes bacterium]|nr:response regulator [Planctomycetota bacterium]
MAHILIVDDDPAAREFLATLLGYRGHRLREAANGAEALRFARAEPPDLVVTDILMPTMDGFEFARQLRTDARIATTPVIFYSASFRQGEAKALAQACGACHLEKPAEPETILKTVDAALAQGPSPVPLPLPQEFDREHLRLVTDRLAHEVEQLKSVNARLTALMEISRLLALEEDRHRLLVEVCHSARDILRARYAALGMLDEKSGRLRPYLISGLEDAQAAALGTPLAGMGPFQKILSRGRPWRCRNLLTHPDAATFFLHHPRVHSFLGVPIASPHRLHGVLCLSDKLGAEEFHAEDERLAVALGTQLGVAYENALRREEIKHCLAQLHQETAEKTQANALLHESRRRWQALFDNTRDALLVADEGGYLVEVNPAACILLGYDREEFLRLHIWDLLSPSDLPAGQDLWRTILAAGKGEGEWTLRHWEGMAIEIEYRVVPHFVPGLHLAVLRRRSPK